MATLEQEKISVTLPSDVSAFFRRRAQEANTTVDREIAVMAWAFMEDEEDEISDEEDRRLSELVDEAEAEQEGKRFYTHKEAWGL